MPTSPLQIVFKFKESASEEDISASLDKIRGLKGIFNARTFNAKADASIKRMFIAEVNPAASAETVLQSVKDSAHVEYAKIPPTRRLPPPHRK